MYFIVMAFCFGAVLGSFWDCHFSRKKQGESNLHGRSHCDSCGEVLRWYELIPIFSYLLAGGKCRRCKAKIPRTAYFAELLSATLWSCATASLMYSENFVKGALTAIVFLALSVDAIADMETGEGTWGGMIALFVVSLCYIMFMGEYEQPALYLTILLAIAIIIGLTGMMGHADIVAYFTAFAVIGLVGGSFVMFTSALLAVGEILYHKTQDVEVRGIRMLPYISVAMIVATACEPYLSRWLYL